METINYKKAHFLHSFPTFSAIPRSSVTEFCIIGRSNVGKSSFLNHALENNSLARVSKTPGRTQHANCFGITEYMQWMDLPGYGYAKASINERNRWSELITNYLEKRENLAGVIWLIDIRHIDMAIDRDFFYWVTQDCRRNVFPLLTKADKISKQTRSAVSKQVHQMYSLTTHPVLYSTKQSECRINFWKQFLQWITANNYYDYLIDSDFV